MRLWWSVRSPSEADQVLRTFGALLGGTAVIAGPIVGFAGFMTIGRVALLVNPNFRVTGVYVLGWVGAGVVGTLIIWGLHLWRSEYGLAYYTALSRTGEGGASHGVSAVAGTLAGALVTMGAMAALFVYVLAAGSIILAMCLLPFLLL